MSALKPQMEISRGEIDAFWKEGDLDAFGWLRIDPAEEEKILVVWVHGWNSDFRGAWEGTVPLVWRVLQDSDASFDFFAFRYGSLIPHSDSYESAAERLRTYLEQKQRSYSRIGFVCHSTGGMIVKKALMDARDPRFVEKAYVVLNLAVAHRGAGIGLRALAWWLVLGFVFAAGIVVTFFTNMVPAMSSWVPSILGGGSFDEVSSGAAKVALYSVLWTPALLMTSLLILGAILYSYDYLRSHLWGKREALSLGFHRIAWQLTVFRRRLISLSEQYMEWRYRRKHRNEKTPSSFDYLGDQDKAVAQGKNVQKTTSGHYMAFVSDENTPTISLPGSHTKFKDAKKYDDFIVTGIASHLSRPTVPDEVAQKLNQNIQDLCNLLDGTLGIHDFLPSQVQALSELSELIKMRDGGAIVLKGEPGSAKSAVMRRAAVHNARLIDAENGIVQPIFLPLYRMPRADSQGNRYGLDWQSLAAWWTAECQKLGNNGASKEWFKHALRNKAVVFLDGADDFIARTGEPLENLLSLVVNFRTKWPMAKLVIALRSSEVKASGLNSTDIRYTIEMPPLNDAEIAALSGCDRDLVARKARQIEEQGGDEVVALMRNVVVAARLRGVFDEETQSTIPNTPGQFLEFILMRFVQGQRRAAMAEDNAKQLAYLSDAEILNILTAGTHLSFSEGRTLEVITISEIQSAANKHRESERHLGDHENLRAAGLAFIATSETNIVSYLFRKFGIHVVDEGSTGEVSIRCQHRVWEEFLEARYMADAIRNGNARPLMWRPAITRMYFLAGNLFYDSRPTVNREFIQSVFKIAKESGYPANPVGMNAIGNFLGLLGHSDVTIDADAFDELIGNCDPILSEHACETPMLVRVVFLQTLGFRMLCDHNTDHGLRRRLLEHLEKRLIAVPVVSRFLGLGRVRAPVTLTHLVLCLLHSGLLRQRRDSESSAIPVRIARLAKNSDLVQDSLSIVACVTREGKSQSEIDKENKLGARMQEIFSLLLNESHPKKAIVFTTYLIALVAAHSNSLIMGKRPEELISEFSSRAPSEAFVAMRERVFATVNIPELKTIWAQCEDLINTTNENQRV